MTAAIPPVVFRWDGESMVPRHPRIADKHFVIGQDYTLLEHLDRSAVSHRHYFACVNEAWKSLPEDLAERFPTADHLRKWALIKAGYRDERTFPAASKAEAVRIAAFLRPMDDYAVVIVREAVVIAYTAKSQNTRSMAKQEFQESKDAVLTVLADMIGVAPETLSSQHPASGLSGQAAGAGSSEPSSRSAAPQPSPARAA